MNEKKTLVLVHGHGVDASIWDGIYADLLSDGPVLRPDFARLTNHTTIDGYADDLYGRLQAEGVNSIVLIGHSMGGYMALAFAERHPQMVRGLCLFHSTAYADDEPKKEQRRQTIEGMKTQGSAPFIEKTIPKMVASDYPAAAVQKLVAHYRNLPVDALVAGMEAIAGRPDRTHVLRDAPFPVLLVLGKQDQLIDYDKNRTLADLSGQISVATMEVSGHLSMIEQPDEAIAALRTFSARN